SSENVRLRSAATVPRAEGRSGGPRSLVRTCGGGGRGDESAAENPRTGLRIGIKHRGLAGRDPVLRRGELQRNALFTLFEDGRDGRAGGADARRHGEAGGRDVGEIAVADPVDVAQTDGGGGERLARPDHDLAAGGVEADDEERLAGRHAEALA